MKRFLLSSMLVALSAFAAISVSAQTATITTATIVEAGSEITIGTDVNFTFEGTFASSDDDYKLTIGQNNTIKASGTMNWLQTPYNETIAKGSATFSVSGSFTTVAAREDGTKPALDGPGFFEFKVQNKTTLEEVSTSVTANFIVTTTSFPELDALKAKVYPNPAQGNLNVEAPLGSQVTIYSIAGAQVFSKVNVNGLTTISTSDLSSGIYVVKITSNGKTATVKVQVR